MNTEKKTISFTTEKVEGKAAQELLKASETILDKQMNDFSQKLFDHMDPKDTETMNALRPIGERATNTMRTRMSAIMEKYKNTVNPTDLFAKIKSNTLQKADFVNQDNTLTDLAKAFHESTVMIFDIMATTIQEANAVFSKNATKYKPIIDAGNTVKQSLQSLLSYTRSENGFVDVLTTLQTNPQALDQFLNRQAATFEESVQNSPLYHNSL